MSELAEGARLEIVCAVNSGTEGSNPSLSAIGFKIPFLSLPHGLYSTVYDMDSDMTWIPAGLNRGDYSAGHGG